MLQTIYKVAFSFFIKQFQYNEKLEFVDIYVGLL